MRAIGDYYVAPDAVVAGDVFLAAGVNIWFGSVIRGDVSMAFAKRYHPSWYKEIVGNSEPRK